jgi:hypothetical protein
VSDAAVQVSGAIVEQASEVSREVSSVATRLVEDTRSQLRERAETQLGHLAEGLDLLHRQTLALAQGRLDDAGSLVGYVQEGADQVGDLAERVQQRGLDGLVVDIKRFARSRPVVFLMGSAVAGLAVGRLLRNEAAAVQGRRAQDQVPAGETRAGSSELERESGQESDPAASPAVSAEPARVAGQ